MRGALRHRADNVRGEIVSLGCDGDGALIASGAVAPGDHLSAAYLGGADAAARMAEFFGAAG